MISDPKAAHTGKRRSRRRLTSGKHHLHSQKQEHDVNTTESDSEEDHRKSHLGSPV